MSAHYQVALRFAPVALTVIGFFMLRSMARTALQLDDAAVAQGRDPAILLA